MSSEEGEVRIRRILVALDASTHSRAALAAAADLAGRFHAELLGMFVEDVNLLRLAELPFAREVFIYSARRRELSTREMERQLHAQARRARELLRAEAERAELEWSFEVARGRITAELLRAASEADMIILGRAGWSLTQARRLGSTARSVAAQAPSMALLLQEGGCLGPPVMVVYDGSEIGARALETALGLSEDAGDILTVILADGHEALPRLREEVNQHLRGAEQEVELRYVPLSASNVQRLAHMVRMEGCGTLVLPARSRLLHKDMLLDLLDETEIPVLLVR
jgi:nucleotide-binding universal stress UspA family protein